MVSQLIGSGVHLAICDRVVFENQSDRFRGSFGLLRYHLVHARVERVAGFGVAPIYKELLSLGASQNRQFGERRIRPRSHSIKQDFEVREKAPHARRFVQVGCILECREEIRA